MGSGGSTASASAQVTPGPGAGADGGGGDSFSGVTEAGKTESTRSFDARTTNTTVTSDTSKGIPTSKLGDVYKASDGRKPRTIAVPKYAKELGKHGGEEYDPHGAVEPGAYSLGRALMLCYQCSAAHLSSPLWVSEAERTVTLSGNFDELSIPMKMFYGESSVLLDRASQHAARLTHLPDTYDFGSAASDVSLSRGILRHKHASVRVMVVHNEAKRELVITFCGTSSLKETITTSKFFKSTWKVAGSAYKCQTDFLQAWHTVSITVMDLIDKLWATGKYAKLFITGSSVGGALATCASFQLAQERADVQAALRCYTFGSPAVGNCDFVDAYNKAVPWTYRHVTHTDVVPCVPPPLFGFDHVGTPVFMNDVGLWVNPESAVLDGPDNGWHFVESALEHHGLPYISTLLNNQARAGFGHANIAALETAWEAFIQSSGETEVLINHATSVGDGGVLTSRIHVQRVTSPSTAVLAEAMGRDFGVSESLTNVLLEACIELCEIWGGSKDLSFDAFLASLWHIVGGGSNTVSDRNVTVARAFARRTFNRFDSNGNSLLEAHEFWRFMQHVYGESDRSEVAKSFRSLGIDTSATAVVSFDEVFAALWSSRTDFLTTKDTGHKFPLPYNVWDAVDELDGKMLRDHVEFIDDGSS